MKIRFYSDLHTEFGKFKIPPGDNDTVLVLAGDIGVGMSAWPMVEKALKSFKAVIYVLGNHEYYNRCMPNLQKDWKEKTNDRFFVLENKSVKIDDVTFYGCTLWSDFNKGDPYYMAMANYYMNDFKMIGKLDNGSYSKSKWQRLQALDAHALHLESRKWLSSQDMKSKSVVVTHHCPSSIFMDLHRYGKSDLNGAYYSNMESLIEKLSPDLWIAGHTHKYVDDYLHNTRLVSNPRGYIGHEVVPMFNPTWEIEI